MGLKVRAVIVTLVLITIAVLMSCSESTAPDTPEPPYTVTDSTVIIPPQDQAAILDYSPEGVLVLDPASALADSIQVGDILIGRNDEFAYAGFLRKVTGIERQRDGISFQTDFAQLVEAFTSLHISECYQLKLSDIRESQLREGVTLNRGRDDDLFGFSLDQLLFDLDGDEGTVHDQITIDGSYDFTAEICLEIESHFLSLERFEIGLTTVAEADIDLTAEAQWEFADELTFTLGTLYLGCITFDGIIYLVPTLTLAVHIDGDLTVTLTTSLHYEERLRIAVGWSDSQGPYHEKESEPTFTYTPPELTATCNFEAGPSLSLACLLYGLAGPYIEGYLALEFEAEIGSDPCEPDLIFSLDCCLYGKLGLQCELLDLDFTPIEYIIYCQPIDESPWIFDLDGTGAIYIDPNPDELNAPWILSGPCNYYDIGGGDQTEEGLLPGEYTVNWQHVPGWVSPENQTRIIGPGDIITITGDYTNEHPQYPTAIDTIIQFVRGRAFDVDQIADGGFIVGGTNPSPNWGRAIAMLTSPNGSVLWERSWYSNPLIHSQINRVLVPDEYSVVVGGYYEHLEDGHIEGAFLKKLNLEGNILWSYSCPYGEWLSDMSMDTYGCIYHLYLGSGNSHWWGKLDEYGDTVWRVQLPGWMGRASLCSDGSHIIGGKAQIGAEWNAKVLRIASSGEIEWEMFINGYSRVSSVVGLPNGNAVIALIVGYELKVMCLAVSGETVWEQVVQPELGSAGWSSSNIGLLVGQARVASYYSERHRLEVMYY